MKITTWVFFLHEHSKFWNVSLGQKVELKPLLLKTGSLDLRVYMLFRNQFVQQLNQRVHSNWKQTDSL